MKSLKVLIVEDDLTMAESIQETLEQAGHEIVGKARNSREALNVVKHQMPDLALLDITLEGTADTGIMIAKQMIAISPMPVIYLTAHDDPGIVAQAQETRPAAYLLKPFRHKELAIQIELAYYNYKAQHATLVNPHTSPSLFLPVDQGKGYIKVNKKEVMYLMAAGSYVEVHTVRDSKPLVFSMNLGYLSQFFMIQGFHRLSRSLVVNLEYIERIEKGQLFMTNRDTAVPFPENQHRELLQRLAIVRTP
ncbi:LytR/AlgR family response regulator transcription factor [Runella limosa]|uniref:LytR/AlgR family response regulator transcription factor n=1 Tax=Runella limosa TaxID=370978 RepID=UPI00040939C8|nr:response regulator [Runella limosa]